MEYNRPKRRIKITPPSKDEGSMGGPKDYSDGPPAPRYIETDISTDEIGHVLGNGFKVEEDEDRDGLHFGS